LNNLIKLQDSKEDNNSTEVLLIENCAKKAQSTVAPLKSGAVELGIFIVFMTVTLINFC